MQAVSDTAPAIADFPVPHATRTGRAVRVSPPDWVFTALLVLVVLAPLPLGSAREWSAMAMVAATGIVVCWEAAAILLSAKTGAALWRGSLFIPIAFGLALLWAVAQIVLPACSLAHPVWQLAGEVLHRDLSGRISLEPYEGTGIILRLLTYAGVFWLAMRHCVNRARAETALRIIAYAGFAYAIYGLVAQLSGSDTILWFQKWAYQGALTSTFVNRNSYATYAGLGLLAALALLVERWRQILKIETDFRNKIAFLLEDGFSRSAPLLAGVAALIAAILLTGSRGGTLSVVVGVGAFLTASAFARILRLPLFASIAGMLAVLSGLLFASGGEYLMGRIEDGIGTGTDGRTMITAVTGQAISNAPVLGTGLASYPYAYRMHENGVDRMVSKPTEAHDSYLENAAELGIPAALLLFAALAMVVLRCALGLIKRRRDRIFPVLGLSASVLVGVHALADFSLQIPAIAMTYAFLLGVAYAQSFNTRDAGVRDRSGEGAPGD